MSRLEILFSILLTLGFGCICEKLQCNWGRQYLCGDTCIWYDLHSFCLCGNETLTPEMVYYDHYTCCNQGACHEDWSGNVSCNGMVQHFELPCHGSCKQSPGFGLSTFSCKDQTQCVEELKLCRGVPNCRE